MLKNVNKRYLVNGQQLSLKKLNAAAPLVEGKNRTSFVGYPYRMNSSFNQ
jgi:hypothetical protein